MTEDDARQWVHRAFGDETCRIIASAVDLILAENERQNLIAKSTVNSVWTRHVVDSLQLVGMAVGTTGLWVDVGTGGGFPGLMAAIAMRKRDFLLVEPRRKRADFLDRVAGSLGLTNVSIAQKHIEKVATIAAVISARAVARLDSLVESAAHCSTPATRWLLPRGQSLDTNAFDNFSRKWRYMFHVEQSLVSATSQVLVLEGVRAR